MRNYLCNSRHQLLSLRICLYAPTIVFGKYFFRENYRSKDLQQFINNYVHAREKKKIYLKAVIQSWKACYFFLFSLWKTKLSTSLKIILHLYRDGWIWLKMQSFLVLHILQVASVVISMWNGSIFKAGCLGRCLQKKTGFCLSTGVYVL